MFYDEINDFCENICLSNENIEKFKQFKNNYTYFSPYFDFLMFELNYIFINPILEENTFLVRIDKGLFKVNKSETEEEINYDTLISKAKRIKNGGHFAHLVACSDSELRIELADNTKIDSCMIDPNGYVMMSTNDGEENGNHETTSNTIVNQLFINNRGLWKTYERKYSAVYLVERFGFIRAVSIKEDGSLIGVERFLTDKLKTFKDLCVSKRNCVFYDWEKEFKEIKEDIEDYKVGRR